ncbi:transglycosylase domain-containing protein [Companilactobacillus sp.]|jgi:penicillin-binding protein 1A|uniref:transglycosylase domain-containing protein n=1 Tax=Companilactobacillus sp. TaxID=2767905 RepID=UPI0025B8DDF7|nr:transglycosylase domain-containing protein [Companilactobacillus sp.]MCH4008247.1 penicillin-binding protein [Companilactobacillus sp.]MCH4051574.1 penicillin-binding protein [Companilactobacillus sp.]MCH4076190.1 penicillin-binding protein [Companilactobacillus sp.]MCH4124765.1 penicillin-binding protein [Companilactobacillus sp.]MCH4131307.1 penicillin-binding protein [Companilactobacillus sp.]
MNNTPNNPNTRKASSPFKSLMKWIGILLGTLVTIFLAIFVFYAFKAPAISQETLQSGGSSTIVDSKGNQIGSLGSNKRNYVTIDKVPQQMQDAVISIEDKNFYSETFGIDPVRIVKSAFNNVSKGTLQGGSTLTQQLIKLTAFSTDAKDQTFKRKMQEAWLAMKVSHDYSKQQVLEFYVNKVYMNNGIYGIETGSRYYYGKSLKELTLPQMALLAGLPNAPSDYDPYTHPTEAKQRRDLVLRAMYDNDKISKSQAEEAIATPIDDGLQPFKENTTGNDADKMMTDPYIKEAISEVHDKGFDPYRDNLKITINMDYDAQKRLYNIVNSSNYVQFPDSKMQVGASIVDPNNGKVIAMIGGRKLSNIQFGLNRAVQTSRSNGSTNKPILDYGPAFEYLNWSTYHQLDDERYVYPGTDIVLKDWDQTYKGQMSLREALVTSRNVPAVKTLDAVGFEKAKAFSKKLGITIPDTSGTSAGIGTDASSLQGAAAYAAFSNGGNYYKPTYVSKIETADGITHSYHSEPKRVMKASTAYMITDVLKGVPTSEGFAEYAAISGLHQAGKTGTTNYSDDALKANPDLNDTAKDSWYNGITPNYSISVWTGYDSPNAHGVSANYQDVAGKIYKAEMQYLSKQVTNKNWKKPSSVVSLPIRTGGSATPIVASPRLPSNMYTTELFVRGHAPNNPYKGESYSSSRSSSSSSEEEVIPNRRTNTDDDDTEDNTNTNETNGNTNTGDGTLNNGNSTNNGNSNNNSGTTTTPPATGGNTGGTGNTGGNTDNTGSNTGGTGNTGGNTGNTGNTGGTQGSNTQSTQTFDPE